MLLLMAGTIQIIFLFYFCNDASVCFVILVSDRDYSLVFNVEFVNGVLLFVIVSVNLSYL
jgi:hypothetical protein